MTLRSLFIDFNSYFASVEQHEDPSLRGRPVGVVPVDADTTCLIAASYEAKAFGVSTERAGQEQGRGNQLPYVEHGHPTQKGQSGLVKKRSSQPGWLASAKEPVPE